jgi:hypothetical protein
MFQKSAFACLFAVFTVASLKPVNASTVIVNLHAADLGYSSVSGQVYASVPDGAPVNPDSLTPINPNTGALGSAVPIGFNPGRIAVASDGSYVFTVVDGQRGIERYNVSNSTSDQLVTINGGPSIGDMYAIPGRPTAVLVHLQAAFSPPAISTNVYENGISLPNQVGHGLGVGGPDLIAVDPTNGTRAYGYQNSVSSFDNVPMTISALGVDTNNGPSLQGVLTNNIGHIALIGDRIFDDQGAIFSLSLGVQIGAFAGGSNFLLDPSSDQFFSITTSGSNQTIHAYSLLTLQSLGTLTLSGISGSAYLGSAALGDDSMFKTGS